jgi:hypothetical protein
MWNVSSIVYHLLQVSDSDLTRRKWVCFVSTFEIRFLSFVFFLAVYFTYLGVVSLFFYILFLFLFESSVLFVFRIDSFATRETIIAVLFCFFFFWFLLLLKSYIHIWIMSLSWFYLVLVLVLQEPQEGETRGVSVWGCYTSDVRIVFYHYHFCRYYHVRSEQHTASSQCRT